jgi:thioredoxin-related protein
MDADPTKGFIMRRERVFTIAILACFSLAFTSRAASAQDVRWRHDYAAARKEASDTGRPLLLDFGTEACVWCRKLDATTFRDPRVVKLLNERFIPVKIDGNKEERLTASLGIDAFPTLVLVSPSGKVLARNPGYADAAQMMALLNKAPAPSAPPAVATKSPTPPPARPAVVSGPKSDTETWARINAELDALHPVISAALDR